MILTGVRGNTELRSAKEWPGFKFGGNGSVPPPGWHGGGIDRDDASSVPAAFRAVAIAAEAVAGVCPGVFRGDGLDRVEVNSTWQARFFDGEPNGDEPWESVWSQTEASLTAEGNAYWWLGVDASMRVSSVRVVDPELVEPRRDGSRKVYDVRMASGRVTVDDSQILHFRGVGNPGGVKAPNPVDVFADALGAAVQRARYETSFYENGMGQGLALIYPADMSAAQAREYRDALGPAQGGISNKVRVFGGGPSIQGIGISPRDAQFIEAMQFSVDDVARIYNVTASLLGSSERNLSSLQPEHELTRWLRFGLGPRLRRISAAINRHPLFFGAGARDVFAFETSGVVQGDVITEDTIAHQQIQDGRLLVDEWRLSQGLAPLPNGWGSIPQIVPVGGAPNPNMVPMPTGGVEPVTEPAAELERARFGVLEEEIRRMASDLTSELRASARRRAEAPPINVSVDNPAAVVNVELDVAPLAETVERALEAVEEIARRSDEASRRTDERVAAAMEQMMVAPEPVGPDPSLKKIAAAVERLAKAAEAADDAEQLRALDRIALAVLDVAAAERQEEVPGVKTVTFERGLDGLIKAATIEEE